MFTQTLLSQPVLFFFRKLAHMPLHLQSDSLQDPSCFHFSASFVLTMFGARDARQKLGQSMKIRSTSSGYRLAYLMQQRHEPRYTKALSTQKLTNVPEHQIILNIAKSMYHWKDISTESLWWHCWRVGDRGSECHLRASGNQCTSESTHPYRHHPHGQMAPPGMRKQGEHLREFYRYEKSWVEEKRVGHHMSSTLGDRPFAHVANYSITTGNTFRQNRHVASTRSWGSFVQINSSTARTSRSSALGHRVCHARTSAEIAWPYPRARAVVSHVDGEKSSQVCIERKICS